MQTADRVEAKAADHHTIENRVALTLGADLPSRKGAPREGSSTRGEGLPSSALTAMKTLTPSIGRKHLRRMQPFSCPSCHRVLKEAGQFLVAFQCRFTKGYPAAWRHSFLRWLRPADFGEIMTMTALSEWLDSPQGKVKEKHRYLMDSVATIATECCVFCWNKRGYEVDGERLLLDGAIGPHPSWDAHLSTSKYWYSRELHRSALISGFDRLAAALPFPKEERREISPRLRWLILVRDGHRCQSCGATALESRLHIDHVRPFAKGGLTRPDNLRALCEDCNLGKSDLL